MAASLYALAKKACIKNIRFITDVGDIPYEHIRPVLLKLENPEQLNKLEENSEQLIGPSSELWREFIKRDIPHWEKKDFVPKDPLEPGAWYAKYKELLEENKREVDEDAVAMRAVLDSIATERAKHTSKLVDHIPQNNRKRKAGDNGNFAIVPGQRKKVMTGKGVMDKIRQETKVSSIFSTRKSNVAMTTPTHQLQNRASQIRALPKGLIEEHRRAPATNYKDPSQSKPTTIIAPRKRASLSSPIKPASPMGSEYRVKRPLDVEPSSSDSTSADSRSVVSTSTAKSSPPPQTGLSSPLLKPMSYAVPRQRTSSPFTNGCRPVAKLKKPPADPMMPTKRRKIA